MTTLPTPKVRTLIEATPAYERWESKTLAWVHVLTDTATLPDGYKPSTKYPGWGWAELTALPTAPTQDTPATQEVLRDAFGPFESLDTAPPADLTALSPDFSTTRAALIGGEANDMIDELLAGHVELVPAPEPKHAGHMIRQSSNPQWYKDMYRDGYTSKDTCLNALARIVQGKPTDNRYDCRLLNIIENDRLPAVLTNYPHLVITE